MADFTNTSKSTTIHYLLTEDGYDNFLTQENGDKIGLEAEDYNAFQFKTSRNSADFTNVSRGSASFTNKDRN